MTALHDSRIAKSSRSFQIFSKNSTEEILVDNSVVRADGLRLQVVSNEEGEWIEY